MKQSNKKTPFVFRIGVALLCAMLITSHMMGELYARYHSSGTGSATASVAKFSVSCSSDSNTTKTLEIGSEETVTYSFTVTNTSDVTIQYKIVIENLPQGVDVVSGNDGPFTLSYGASQSHILTFKAKPSATEVTEQKVSIKIDAFQVD